MRLHRRLLPFTHHWPEHPVRTRIVQAAVVLFMGVALGIAGMAAYLLLFVAPKLPSLEALTDYRPKIPLRIYTADHVLIGEFGEEHRDFVAIGGMPQHLKDAILAIEDDRFYEHGGVDLAGIVRAGVANLHNSRSQGASTITMQVARTFFLTRQKTYSRKLQEILLAYKIESRLTKDQILELYMNQIYLGERAYGFGSAARIYFGKSVQELSVAEAAMLAGLPKAPASANPVVNPKRAAQRQQHILKRMRDLHYINDAQYAGAAKEQLTIRKDSYRFASKAEHAAELVRQFMHAQYGEDAYKQGFSVFTTINSADQNAAYRAVRQGVMNYDRRHGYRGPEAFVDLPADVNEREQVIDEVLLKHPDSDMLRSAVVTSASAKLVKAELLSGEEITIAGEGLRFAASALAVKASAQKRIRAGAVIRVTQDAKERWSIVQLPEVSAAFVALNAQDGSFRAMVGSFDFSLNQYDHVTQAKRQPGSSIKPFIYSAALERGFFPATLVNDAPLSEDSTDGSVAGWDPKNDDGRYDGPVTMRTGLTRSKNLVSIRILRTITPGYAQQHLARFGLDPSNHPADLTMTLGTGSVTPAQLAGAYAVFANGGYRVTPHLIQKIVDGRGNLLSEARPVIAGDETARAIDARNAFIMDTMLRDVVSSGTAHAAGQKLRRSDLAGKTGTTNNAVDGWFAGYGADIVGVAWMGYDKPRSLGSREFGGSLALPIWIDYMREALKGRPSLQRPVPQGLAQVDGDFMYQEYIAGGAVRSLDVNVIQTFWERLFGPRRRQSAPAPIETPSQRPEEDLYRSGQ